MVCGLWFVVQQHKSLIGNRLWFVCNLIFKIHHSIFIIHHSIFNFPTTVPKDTVCAIDGKVTWDNSLKKPQLSKRFSNAVEGFLKL
jgi:hypothetical protein